MSKKPRKFVAKGSTASGDGYNWKAFKWNGKTYAIPRQDSQRQKVYDAEWSFWGTRRNRGEFAKTVDPLAAPPIMEGGAEGLTRKQVRALVKRVWESDVVRSIMRSRGRAEGFNPKAHPIKVKMPKQARGSSAYARPAFREVHLNHHRKLAVIDEPVFQKWIVLHEVAHVVAGSKVGHQWPFCDIYATLVFHFISPAAALGLRQSFDDHGIRHKQWHGTLAP